MSTGLAQAARGMLTGRPGRARWTALAAVAATAVVAVLVRLPLIGLPLDSDEGGYALVAHRWAAGATLYSAGAWVDRPPGLVLVFRWVDALAYSPLGLRVASAVAAAVLAVGAAAASWALAGRRAAVVTGLLTAVVLAGPWLQGYELNGELLAAALAAWAVALALWWRAGSLPAIWLAVAGLLAGSAPLMKQSGIDAVVVVLLVAALSPRRTRTLTLAAAGAAVPLGLVVVLATLGGWSRWWFALVGSETQLSAGQPVGYRIGSMLFGALLAAPDTVGLALAAAAGVAMSWSDRRAVWPGLLWAAAAVFGACLGPFGHPHYWVQAVAPAAVLAGLVVPRLRLLAPDLRRFGVAVLATAAVLPLVGQAVVLSRPSDQRTSVLTKDPVVSANVTVASWLDAHTRPQDQVFALVAGAALYLQADRSTSFPYLWYGNVEHVSGAIPLLRSWLASRSGPRYVVVYQNPDEVDPTGALLRVLEKHYLRVGRAAGYDVLERRMSPGA